MKLRKKIDAAIAMAVWKALFFFVRCWSEKYMDQYERVKFKGTWGTVYLSIDRMLCPSPGAFRITTKPERS